MRITLFMLISFVLAGCMSTGSGQILDTAISNQKLVDSVGAAIERSAEQDRRTTERVADLANGQREHTSSIIQLGSLIEELFALTDDILAENQRLRESLQRALAYHNMGSDLRSSELDTENTSLRPIY